MQKNVLLFGAGKSATVLIEYLIKQAKSQNWQIQIVDTNLETIETKTKKSKNALAFAFDIATDTEARQSLIANAAIVISLLPPNLHIIVAKDCIFYQRNLLTASYLNDEIKALTNEIEKADVLFLYEMGLDPGIDHMSAMELIDDIQKKGGIITSFKSHCGGLVAPESDTNPWHYKISWNPRNVVLAGKAGAQFLENGKTILQTYDDLFLPAQCVFIEGMDDVYSYYANRDSLNYIDTYNLKNVETFIRTTLRHPDFIYGWNNLVALHFTDEEKVYDTTNKSLAQLFTEHLNKNEFGDWLSTRMLDNLNRVKDLATQLSQLLEEEEEAFENIEELDESFMAVDENGNLTELNTDEIKEDGAVIIAEQLRTNNLDLKLLMYLGLNDETTIVNKGLCSAADILQFALEKKLVLEPTDKDMIIMQHEIGFLFDKENKVTKSTLIVKGKDATNTAMAKTVGLPLGIAAKLILNGTIASKGLQIPISKEIYLPVLFELKKNGIEFINTYL